MAEYIWTPIGLCYVLGLNDRNFYVRMVNPLADKVIIGIVRLLGRVS